MPAVLSVTMAVGARRLAARQAIVSRLASIEELAGVDVLCSDKTGTLTQNKLTLGDPVPVGGETRDELVLDRALASRAENQDTIDMAVIAGLKDQDALKAYSTSHYQPFDPVHKRTEATITDKDGKTFKVTKGAVQVVLALSKNAAAVKDDVDKATEALAKRGYRALGVAKDRVTTGNFSACCRSTIHRGRTQGHDRQGRRARHRRQDGHGRSARDRQGDRRPARPRHRYPRCEPVRRHQGTQDRQARSRYRDGGRLRAGLSSTSSTSSMSCRSTAISSA